LNRKKLNAKALTKKCLPMLSKRATNWLMVDCYSFIFYLWTTKNAISLNNVFSNFLIENSFNCLSNNNWIIWIVIVECYNFHQWNYSIWITFFNIIHQHSSQFPPTYHELSAKNSENLLFLHLSEPIVEQFWHFNSYDG
jgi:hypothetical protein